jgi:hypothetical protein
MRFSVTPAQAGTQSLHKRSAKPSKIWPVWVPAFAGMTTE